MKNSAPTTPIDAATIEPKAASPRAIPARELTLEQFRQLYFPELVSEHQDRATAPAAQREAA